GYERSQHSFIASRPAPAPDWRDTLAAPVIGGLCDSTSRRATPWRVGAQACRIAERSPTGAWAGVAQAQSRCCNITHRILASYLSSLRHFGRLRDGCYLGSRHRNNAVGGRDGTRKRISGNRDQGRGILLCSHGPHLLCAHFLGASDCRTHKPLEDEDGPLLGRRNLENSGIW